MKGFPAAARVCAEAVHQIRQPFDSLRVVREVEHEFLTSSAYEMVTAAADAQGVTINQFCRTAIMDAAEPLPEDLEEDGGIIPAWLLALLVTLRNFPRHGRRTG